MGAGHVVARCFTCMVDSSLFSTFRLWKNIWNPKSCAAQCQEDNRKGGGWGGGYNTALQWGRCLLSSLYSLSSFVLPVNFKAICQSLIQHSSISLAADIGKGGRGGAALPGRGVGEGRGRRRARSEIS